MRRRIGLVMGCILVGSALVLAVVWLPRPAHSRPAALPTARLTPALAQALAQAAPDARLRCLVYLSAQPDWQTLTWPAGRRDRRAAVVDYLQQFTAGAQADLRAQLDEWQQQGAITAYRPYWIFNGVWVEGSPAIIQALAGRPEVARLTLDARRQYVTTTLSAATPPFAPWGVAQIGAPYVHAGLGITGTGVTVAVMDTGADWLHPALFANYRGQRDGVIEHAGHWYDATQITNTTPTDPHGHGTHVLGSAVGRLGLGVAPGASWIAVRVFDAYGFAYTSDIHAGFEWLLAPAGDPALAPDIVNGSWGSAPTSGEWLNDVAALRAAGILPVFAAGNTGPLAMSVATPAGYADVLAVAASDDLDQIAWFSSQGPSVWTAQSKPTLAAPGAGVLSAYPGEAYAIASGTSMAAPHVSGALALLLAGNPELAAPAAVLTTTAHPLSTTHPNPVSGWGRLDVYAAVASQMSHGRLTGQVMAEGAPVPYAVVTVTTAAGVALAYPSDVAGQFAAALAPGVYSVAAAPFGYVPAAVQNLVMVADQTTPITLTLTPLPAGQVQGVVREAVTASPLPARIEVVGAPVATQADNQGTYTLALPAGVHTLRAVLTGQRVLTGVVTVAAGQSHTHDFTLERAPRILLVDSGQWYYLSKIAYYRDALEDNAYAFDEWEVRHPLRDTPMLSDVVDYEVVVWSAPNDAPGLIGAGRVISDYLGLGGNLLISGQDVAFYDGTGLGAQRWWYALLRGQYEGKTTPLSLTGEANTLFADLALDLNGGSSADNQLAPDYASPQEGSLTEVVLRYADGHGAALAAGACDPYRILYLGFGLEGVAEAAGRAQVVARALDYFQASPTRAGVQFVTPSLERFSLPGARLTYTLEVRNRSELVTDTVTLALEGGSWDYELITPTLSLGPCQSGQTRLVVQAPPDLARGVTDVVSVTARPAGDPSLSAYISLTHQTPNPILFVADHRWYDQAAVYRPLLDDLGLAYDYWEIGPHGEVLGSPSTEMLAAYDIVLWYTGYDWFQPITAAESAALATYLANGGRLFLTSQDYMYYHAHDSLTHDYLGVLDFYESITPTQVYMGQSAGRPGPISATLPLTYGVYQNFSDGLIPRPAAQPALWHNGGMPGAVANQGEGWRTLFWGLPFEALPPADRAPVWRALLGWLGDLGDSTLTSSVRVAAPGHWHTYTLALHNQATAPTNQVTATLSLPPELRIDIASLPPAWFYDLLNHQLHWGGDLLPGASLTLTYRALVEATTPAGAQLVTRARLAYARHQLAFDLQTRVWVQTPDLTPSTLTLSPTTLHPGAPATLTLRLANAGLTPAGWVSATLFLPPELRPLTPTLTTITDTALITGRQVQWRTAVEPGETVTLVMQVQALSELAAGRLPLLLVVDDYATAPLLRFQWVDLTPWQRFFPVARQP